MGISIILVTVYESKLAAGENKFPSDVPVSSGKRGRYHTKGRHTHGPGFAEYGEHVSAGDAKVSHRNCLPFAVSVRKQNHSVQNHCGHRGEVSSDFHNSGAHENNFVTALA